MSGGGRCIAVSGVDGVINKVSCGITNSADGRVIDKYCSGVKNTDCDRTIDKLSSARNGTRGEIVSP